MVALEHNLAALQAQVETLQRTNSALTRDLCLKENYIQLKDQQFRVMQRRLEELEGAVAQWKDRWLQQVNAQQVIESSDKKREDGETEKAVMDRVDEAKWTPWKCNAKTMDRTKAVAKAVAKLEQLSSMDRNKLQPLLMAIEKGESTPMAELVFTDVSEELSRILLLYLVPALLDAMSGGEHQLLCCSRTYYKQRMDVRIGLQKVVETTTEDCSVSSAPTDKSPPGAMSLLGASLLADGSGESLVWTDQEVEETEASHLFDYVELDRRGLARSTVPHGPRELHATKAMFISQPLSGVAATRAVVPPLDKAVDKPVEKVSRRYTLTPKHAGPTFAGETRRTHTMTIGALPSPSQSPSSMGMLPMGSDGDVIPLPPREKDGKIKKIVGSVFDRLSRHKSQQSLTVTSSFQASPVPASVSTRATETANGEVVLICDGCGRGPIMGIKWICRSCRLINELEYELCEKCYGQGIHGKEQEDTLFARVEAIVVRKCPCLASETELLHLLRMGICKANLKKFSFCLTWIADLLQCHRTTDLRARALEIANIPSTVRSEFARLLRELLTRYRPDIELKTEWEPAASAQHGALGPGTPGMRGDEMPNELDTLRIRVKDAPVATTASSGTTSSNILSIS